MIKIDYDKCVLCESCIEDCFFKAMKKVGEEIEINDSKCMMCGHCIAICPQDAVSAPELDMSDVKEYTSDFDISTENLMDFIKFRRSIRSFKDEKIKREDLNNIIQAGRFTPTGGNSQGVSYIVLEDKLKEATKLGLESLNELGEKLLAQDNLDKNLSRYANNWVGGYKKYLENPEDDTYLFFNAKTVILVLGNSTVDAALAASNMELMANTMDIGVCFSGYFVRAVNNSKSLQELLGLEEGENVQVAMVVGYKNREYKRTVPRNKEKVRFI